MPIPIQRPMVRRYHRQHLCLDAGYVGDEVATMAQAFHYTLPVRPRGAEATGVRKRAASGGVLAVTCGSLEESFSTDLDPLGKALRKLFGDAPPELRSHYLRKIVPLLSIIGYALRLR